jgi:hypothetical protein
LAEHPQQKQKQEDTQTQLTTECQSAYRSSRLIDRLRRRGGGSLWLIIIAGDRVELICQSHQGPIHTMSGLIGIFGSAIDVRQFRSGKGRQTQPYGVMHVNAIGFYNDQKNKTIVLALAAWQAKFHITQEMYRAVRPDAHPVFWQDEDHRLRNRIVI